MVFCESLSEDWGGGGCSCCSCVGEAKPSRLQEENVVMRVEEVKLRGSDWEDGYMQAGSEFTWLQSPIVLTVGFSDVRKRTKGKRSPTPLLPPSIILAQATEAVVSLSERHSSSYQRAAQHR